MKRSNTDQKWALHPPATVLCPCHCSLPVWFYEQNRFMLSRVIVVKGTCLMFVSSEGVQEIFSDYAQKYLKWIRCFAFACLFLFSVNPAKYSVQSLQTWLETLQMLIGWNIFKTSIWHHCPPTPNTAWTQILILEQNPVHFSVNHSPSVIDSLKFTPPSSVFTHKNYKKLHLKNSSDMMHVSAKIRQNDRLI